MSWIVISFLFFENDIKIEYGSTYNSISEAFKFDKNLDEPEKAKQLKLGADEIKYNYRCLIPHGGGSFDYEEPPENTRDDFIIIEQEESYDDAFFPTEPAFIEVKCLVLKNNIKNFISDFIIDDISDEPFISND